MSKTPRTPEDRSPDDGCRIAYEAWWEAISLQGDPIRRRNLSGEAFEAGWVAAMAEVKEAKAFLNKIQNEERQQDTGDQTYDRWWR